MEVKGFNVPLTKKLSKNSIGECNCRFIASYQVFTSYTTHISLSIHERAPSFFHILMTSLGYKKMHNRAQIAVRLLQFSRGQEFRTCLMLGLNTNFLLLYPTMHCTRWTLAMCNVLVWLVFHISFQQFPFFCIFYEFNPENYTRNKYYLLKKRLLWRYTHKPKVLRTPSTQNEQKSQGWY